MKTIIYQTLTILFFSILFLQQGRAEEKKPVVIATASMIADMAENIGGDFVDVKSIVPIGGDPHIYEPTPGDAVEISKADIIFKNGLTFEGWLNELIDYSGTKADVIRVTEGVNHISSLTYENTPDPHAWMDAENAIIYAENIKNGLIKIDPDHEKEFEFNFNAFKSDLQSLDAYIKQQINRIPKEKRILITSHDAFQYYGRKYGLQLESIMGTSTDAQAQTSDIMRLSKVLKSSGVPAVFVETTINPKLMKQIAKDHQVIVGGKLFADSIGDKDSEAPTYIDMMKYNTDTIVKALLSNKKAEPAPTSEAPTSTPFIYYILGGLALLALIYFIFLRKRS